MKIIRKSNFDKESVSDMLIAETVHEYYAKFIKGELNEKFSGDTSPDFFEIVPDDYELYEFRP